MQKPPSVRSDHTQLSVKYKYVKFTLWSAVAPKCSEIVLRGLKETISICFIINKKTQ